MPVQTDASSRHLFVHKCCSGWTKNKGWRQRKCLPSSLKRLVWMAMTRRSHSRQTRANRCALFRGTKILRCQKRTEPLWYSIISFIILSIFFLMNPSSLRRRCDAEGEWSLCQRPKKGWTSSILNLSLMMTSRRGSRQRTRMSVRTAVLPPRILWLISKGSRAGEADATWRSSD